MNASSIFQVVGLSTCAGAFVLIVLLGAVIWTISMRRGRAAGPDNSAIHPYQYEDSDDFGGVPTTGAVQDYERDYDPDPLIGSSGFDVQSHDEPD
jgi:hypothetical protein